MAHKSRPLSQAELWDDSALLQSWEDALTEYKTYHGIHARGEKVQDVIESTEMAESDRESAKSLNLQRLSLPSQVKIDQSEELEDGEIDTPKDAHDMCKDSLSSDPCTVSGQTSDQAKNAEVKETRQSVPPVLANMGRVLGGYINLAVDANLVKVQDEAAKNMMMSWYYSGYYTGFYEGQQSVTACVAD